MSYTPSTTTALSGNLANLTVGTPNQSWQVQTGSSGVLLKNTPSGLEIRTYQDASLGNLSVQNLTVQGTQTIANSQSLAVTDRFVIVNQSGLGQNAGLAVYRSGQIPASLTWNESLGYWTAGLSGSESYIVRGVDTGTFVYAVLLNSSGAAINQNLTQSGVLLGGQINSLSGYTSSSLATTGAILLSYDSLVSGWLDSGIALTGANLYAIDLALSGTLLSVILATGVAANVYSVGMGVNLSGNLTATGQTLYQLAAEISGNLGQTGATLFARDASISGGLETRIDASGAAAIAFGIGVGVSTSGTVVQTGSSLYALLTGTSGQSNRNYAPANANYLYTTGNQSVGNVKTFNSGVFTGAIAVKTSAAGCSLDVSGAARYLATSEIPAGGGAAGLELWYYAPDDYGLVLSFNRGASIYKPLWIAGSYLSFQQGNTERIHVDTAGNIYVGTANLTPASNPLNSALFIQPNAGVGVGTLNPQTNLHATGVVRADAGFSSGSTNLSNIFASQSALTLTGQTLQGRVDSLSGFVGQVSGGLEIRIAQTGAAIIAYTNGLGANLSGNLASTGSYLYNLAIGVGANLSGNLTQTGVVLWNRDASISGVLQTQIDSSATSAQLYQTGLILYNAIVGGDTNLSGNLTVTGQTLYQFASDISGNLIQSGSSLFGYVIGGDTNLSGNLTQTGITLLTRDFLVSGWLSSGLFATGSTLDSKINSLSGFATNPTVNNFVIRSGTYDLQSLTVSSNYSLVGTESRVYCNNNTPITLSFPSAILVSGYIAKIKLINTGSIYLTGIAGQTFDGSPLYSIAGQWQAREVHSNGANWYIW